MLCPKCKKLLEDSWIVCPYCGKSLVSKQKQHRRRANGEGSVYKRGSTYTARVIYGYELRNGKAQPIKRDVGGFKTMREAYEYIPTLKKEGPRQKVHGEDYSRITFEELYNKLIERHSKRVTAGTLNCYKSAHKYFTEIYSVPFASLNTEDWQMCIDDCPRGLRTRQNMKALGTLMYKLAAELRVFGLNTKTDFASLVWMEPEETESRLPFSPDEFLILQQGMQRGVKYADWIVAMCLTGFRPTEFLDLTKDSFDQKSWTLRGGAKTEAGKNRIVPIHPQIRPLIAQRFISASHYLFEDAQGNHLTCARFRETIFYPCLAQLGIQPVPVPGGKRPERTPYSCRHTFSTLMKNVKGSAKDKAALMGHTSYEMTMHYQHEDFDALRSIIESIK